jgi:hypothetical protein
MFFDRKYLFGILALIFLQTVVLPEVTLSQENQTGKQNVLRQASLEWMQVGLKQYQYKQFAEAEKSFRRALVFKKYLTEAERLKINTLLTKARIDLSEGKQPVESTKTDDKPAEQDQPVKAEEKLKDSEPSTAKVQQQTEKEPKIVSSQIEQKDQSVKPDEPEVPEIQLAAETTSDIIVIKDEGLKSKIMLLSDWLSLNRRNILLIGLPILAVLILISKLQKMKMRPGRRVYASYAPANSSFIGTRLNGSNGAVENTNKGHLLSAVASEPKRKSFSQSTEHWKEKHFGHAVDTAKKSPTKEKWPQQKGKSAAGDSTVAKVEKKQCGRCKQFKPLSDFYKNKSTKDGLARWCKQCKKEYRKKRAAGKK